MIRPRLFDGDDARMIARLLVYSVLLLWLTLVLATALGIGVRVFLLAKGT